ncbi:MAG TPA: hypothetical protein V6D17_09220 [Candidatus Obscuribacterales bacterium]
MKTNHRRGFVANTPRDQSMWGRSKRLSEHAVGVSIGNDFTDGHRGMARAKRGAKKRLRALERLDARRVIRQELEEMVGDEES